jgi:4,5-DOPA dioxygenase extradiol
MKTEIIHGSSPVLFFPHGGGPLPLLGHGGHREMIDFLESLAPKLGKPSAILVISAHWEENKPTITSGKTPSLLYDYNGFPKESYEIEYPAPGNPALSHNIYRLFQENGIDAKLDAHRGFDHGLFIPLKIIFPNANIPCVQLSLVNSLDPGFHIQVGRALSKLSGDNVLVMGSGFSFHNIKAFTFRGPGVSDLKNESFQQWLIDTCTNMDMSEKTREKRLIDWADAPYARYCHPREEHLLPLHICCGLSGAAAKLVFDGEIMGKKSSAFLW